VILLVSKPPGANTVTQVNERLELCTKPVVTCYLGGQQQATSGLDKITTTFNLDAAATAAIRLAGGIRVDEESSVSPESAERERAKLKATQKYVRGVFSGGTLCYQAQQVLRDAGLFVRSNEPLEKGGKLQDSSVSVDHTLVDMGADEFTEGKPHPMVDSAQRVQRILLEAEDPQVAVLLLDCVLGYVAAEDPGGDIAAAISEAIRKAKQRGDNLSVVVSICGTELDAQGLGDQVEALERAGATVLMSGFQAASYATALVTGRG
jgi:FdrA protein